MQVLIRHIQVFIVLFLQLFSRFEDFSKKKKKNPGKKQCVFLFCGFTEFDKYLLST